MNRAFHHLPKLGLAVCIGVIVCLSLFAQRHSPGAVSAAQNAPIADRLARHRADVQDLHAPRRSGQPYAERPDLGDAPDSTNGVNTAA